MQRCHRANVDPRTAKRRGGVAASVGARRAKDQLERSKCRPRALAYAARVMSFERTRGFDADTTEARRLGSGLFVLAACRARIPRTTVSGRCNGGTWSVVPVHGRLESKLRRRISVFGHVTFCSPAIV